MFEKIEIGTGDGFAGMLASASLDRFDRLMYADLGRPVRRKQHQAVIALTVKVNGGTRGFYLKRCAPERPRQIARALLRATRPQGACQRELAMIRALKRHGVPVMNPAAWGQRRVLGWPREGFLLVEEVPGRDLGPLFGGANKTMRLRLLSAVGSLLGRLHRLGFFQRIRLRDLICSEIPADARQAVVLVLIDREAHEPAADKPRRFTSRRAVACLARCYCKLLQAGQHLDRQEMTTFLCAYRGAVGGQRPEGRQLIHRVALCVARLTRQTAKYHGVDAAAPRVPHVKGERSECP